MSDGEVEELQVAFQHQLAELFVKRCSKLTLPIVKKGIMNRRNSHHLQEELRRKEMLQNWNSKRTNKVNKKKYSSSGPDDSWVSFPYSPDSFGDQRRSERLEKKLTDPSQDEGYDSMLPMEPLETPHDIKNPPPVGSRSLLWYMRSVLHKLRKADKYRIFFDPVDIEEFEDYLTIVETPMDLSLIGKNISDLKYESLEDMEKDVFLIFDNCLTYNEKGSFFYEQGKSVRSSARRIFKATKSEFMSQEHQPHVHPFSLVEDYLFPTEEDLLRRKLQTELKGHCCLQGEDCCYSSESLGAFDPSLEQFESTCNDRKHCVECSEDCGCDPEKCMNRKIGGKQLDTEYSLQEVFGIDQFTFRLLREAIRVCPEGEDDLTAHRFLEQLLLSALNRHIPRSLQVVRQKTHLRYSLEQMLEEETLEEPFRGFVHRILLTIRKGVQFPVYSKGKGVIMASSVGKPKNDVLLEYLGEVYPPWRWFEKESLVEALERSLGSKTTLGFYNISLERKMDDSSGYDVVFIDACRKGTYASRLSHSCTPNATSVVFIADGQYKIALVALRDIYPGEEVTFDYHSVTDSLEEYETAICFCGRASCRGRYLRYAGKDAFDHVMKREHGFMHRVKLLLDSADGTTDESLLYANGIRKSMLEGSTPWMRSYLSKVISFCITEREKLPEELVKRGYDLNDALMEAKGIFRSRLSSLACLSDKVRRFCQQSGLIEFPLRVLSPTELVDKLWNAANSPRSVCLKELESRLEPRQWDRLNAIAKENIDTKGSPRVLLDVFRGKLVELRDFLWISSYETAGDLVHLYLSTETFFTIQQVTPFTSDPFDIDDLGLLEHSHINADLLNGRTYNSTFLVSSLLFWMSHGIFNPEQILFESSKLNLQLPSLEQTFNLNSKTDRTRLLSLLSHPTDIHDFSFSHSVLGSPILDAFLGHLSIDSVLDPIRNRHKAMHRRSFG